MRLVLPMPEGPKIRVGLGGCANRLSTSAASSTSRPIVACRAGRPGASAGAGSTPVAFTRSRCRDHQRRTATSGGPMTPPRPPSRARSPTLPPEAKEEPCPPAGAAGNLRQKPVAQLDRLVVGGHDNEHEPDEDGSQATQLGGTSAGLLIAGRFGYLPLSHMLVPPRSLPVGSIDPPTSA